MKGSLIVVGFFALGCILGWSGYLPEVVVKNDITMYVLYLLMFQVGLSIGSDKKLKDILCSIRPVGNYYRDADGVGFGEFTDYQMECVRLPGGRKWFCLLLIVFYPDYGVERGVAGCTDGDGVRNNRIDRQYHP